MTWIWLFIIILLVIIEALTVNLVTIWFIASGIISMILSLFMDSLFIEFLVFVLGGIILLITTRKSLVKLFNKKEEKTNFDRIIGMNGVVIDEIDKNKSGSVKVDGKVWTAISDKKIETSCTVKVLEINGVKLKVEEVES